MFMNALDQVVADPEIRDALEEFRLSPHSLRGSMIAAASQVLEAAPLEYDAYQSAMDAGVVKGADADAPWPLDAVQMLGVLVPRSADQGARVMRRIGQWLAALGLLFAVIGVASIAVWPWTEPFVWAGAAMMIAATLIYGLRWLDSELGLRVRGNVVSGTTPRVEEARDRLMAAITHDEFLAQARTFINTARKDQFGHSYAVAGISGLSETFDSTYQVATSTAAELDGLLTQLDGASIGIAGPRGSGKSTLIRGYCEDDAGDRSQPAAGDLRCMVAAPVDYAARDFVLHLFATFCRGVIRRYEKKGFRALWRRARTWTTNVASGIKIPAEIVFCWIPAAALMHWQQPIARQLHVPADWVFYAGVVIAVLGIVSVALANARMVRRRATLANTMTTEKAGRALATAARRHLVRVRYLQSRTSGWSGTLGLPRGGSGQLSRTSSRTEQPLSYPEIVSEFRGFTREVAADLHRASGRVFIGIDELDKIGTPEQAERFLNEIKGVFGIPHVYFMVSVSDDALTSFERRGLPLRDAFDSSFDEIIHVEPLSYAEARRLLYRRVIGLTEPYVALCHCLSGGLARELIRAARQIIRAGETLAGGRHTGPDGGQDLLVNSSTAFLLLRQSQARKVPRLETVCAAVISDELRRKTRAVAQLAVTTAPAEAQDLQRTLSDVARYLTPGTSAMTIVDIASRPAADESASIFALRRDLAAYAYYCATLQDVFTDKLDANQMIKATTTSAPGSFDTLAAARQAFALDTQLAWQSITEFRQAWSLPVRQS
jgi:hypothetical protein